MVVVSQHEKCKNDAFIGVQHTPSTSIYYTLCYLYICCDNFIEIGDFRRQRMSMYNNGETKYLSRYEKKVWWIGHTMH